MATWSFDTTLPVIQFEAAYKTGWSVNADLPVVRMQAVWAQGWSLRAALPRITSEALFNIERVWALAAELPVVQMQGTYYVLDVVNGVALCVNPVNRAHADYTNFVFNSFCEFQGGYIGATADGIFYLRGADDAGAVIDASCRFGPIDEDSSKLKRVDSAYLNLRHDGHIRVVMKYDEMEEDISTVDYDANIDPEGIHTRRAKFSRGVRGRNLQVGIENISGADFEITDLEVITVPLSRS